MKVPTTGLKVRFFRVATATGHVTAFVDGRPYLGNPRTIPLFAHAQVQLDAYNPAYLANPNVPTSVQQNNYTFRPRTIGLTAILKM